MSARVDPCNSVLPVPRRRAGQRLWTMAYFAAVLAPLMLIIITPRAPGRSFGADLAAGLGFGAAIALALQLVLPGRARALTRWFGADVLIRHHREIAYAIVALVVVHLVVLVVDDPRRIALLNPITAPPRALAASTATLALVGLIVTSRRRAKMGLSYETWRAIHLLLSVAAVGFALVHVLGVSVYSSVPPVRAVVLVTTFAALGTVVQLRWRRPHRQRLYRVVSTNEERGGAVSLELEAVGHAGDGFQPGQFAWLKLASQARSLSEHPFSYASSAHDQRRPCFTVKPLGDFTSRVTGAVPGTLLLVDGPHGSFSPVHAEAAYVFVAGGVGITPVMSFLRSMADAGDERPVTLVYGNRDWESVIFREQLEALESRLNLTVVHVLADPPPGWTGSSGFIDAVLLQEVVDRQPDPFNVFVCGPPPMCRAVERAVDEVGIARRSLHVESFVSV